MEKIADIRARLARREAIGAISRAVGVSVDTVNRYLAILEMEIGTSIACVCGKPRHKGRCGERRYSCRVPYESTITSKPTSPSTSPSPIFNASLPKSRSMSPSPSPIGAGLFVVDVKSPVIEKKKPGRPGDALKEAQRAAIANFHKRRRLAHLNIKPLTPEETQALIAKSGVTIKRYPPGVTLGWTPSWLNNV